MPSYPSSIRTFLQKVNLVDIVEASDYNDLAGEISAIQRALGGNVATASTRTPTTATLVARLAALDAAVGVVETRLDASGLVLVQPPVGVVPQVGVAGLIASIDAVNAALADKVGSAAFSSLNNAVQSRALSSDLDTERSSRIAQGTTLSNADAAEASARTSADDALRSTINDTRLGSGWTNIPDTANKVDPWFGALQVQVRGGIAFMRGGGQPQGTSTSFPLNVNVLVGTLPAFARPQQSKIYPIPCSGHLGHAIVSSTGALSVFFTAAAAWFNFDTVTFSDVVTSSPYAL